jgi:hypothetical protein|tara:strand:+ start:766 stop:1122 length:357 start_codon:yes stop_codon:yes gene_type:complete
MKSLKQMLTIVNDENIGYNALVYSQFTDTIKNYTKVTKLIKPRLVEHCESSNNYFQFKEPKNTGKKGFYIGSVQLVTKNTSRFDVTQFKKDHPELYTQYLTGGVSNELRTNYKLEVKK